VLVTGGSGYLGAELLRQAPEAVGTYRTNAFPGGVPLEIRDREDVRRVAEGHEVVIHTAYVQTDSSVIEDGTAAVAESCAATGARLVHVSSDVVFDGALGRPYRESDQALPINEYGRAKAAAEQVVAERCPGAVTVRTSLIYGGPSLPPSRQEQDALDGEVRFFTDEIRSPVQVGDLASAILDLARRADVAGPVHLNGADDASRYELACLIVAARGGDPAQVQSASFRELGLNRPADCRLASDRVPPLRGVRHVLCARSG
jgi:dTDP-4-dehydrorhamnose reductase